MKYQILFSGINKKNVMNSLSAELAKRVLKVNAKQKVENKEINSFIINYLRKAISR